jgi:hypothetical protein
MTDSFDLGVFQEDAFEVPPIKPEPKNIVITHRQPAVLVPAKQKTISPIRQI